MDKPLYPNFKPLALEDRAVVHDLIWRAQPETSELSFTNLFIWRKHYELNWSIYKEWLLLASIPSSGQGMGLPPLGPGPKEEPVRALLSWLREERKVEEPRLERVDRRLAEELRASGRYEAEPDRDQFDYVYRTNDLVGLAGSRYHGKRNHIARFSDTHRFSYAPFEEAHVIPCLNLAEAWCTVKRCEEDMDLMDEWDAIKECLANFKALEVRGGVILIEGKVEAFTFGELLNERTAVVHLEKANPEIGALYSVINKEFASHEWPAVPLVNREQDLGEPGLRKAKLSYHPAQFVEKYAVGAVNP